jgi:antitoxin ChpS
MLTSTLRAVGGSVMMAIPKALLDVLSLGANDKVALHVEAGRLIIEAQPRPKYTLAELLAQCDPDAENTDEERLWDAADPVGREVF